MSYDLDDDNEALDLLAITEAWYVENGTSEIPEHPDTNYYELSQDQQKLFPLLFESTVGYRLTYGGHQMTNVPGRLIPFMVGVKLGLSDNALFKIMGHHEVQLQDILAPDLGSTDDSYPVALTTATGESVNETDFNIKLFQIFSKLNSRHEELEDFKDVTSRYTMALIHTELSHHWPCNKIERQGKLASKQYDGSITLPEHDFSSILYRLEKPSHLPNNNMMDFLQRSGMLTSHVAKKDTVLYAMWELLLERSIHGEKVPEALVDYCAVHPNPATRATVKRALLSLTENPWVMLPEPEVLLPFLQKKFTGKDFAPVHESAILLLNIVPEDDAESMLASVHHLPSYQKLLINPELILAKIAKEIMEIPAGDLGFSQLSAFRKMSCFQFPVQQIQGFTPEVLVNHVLDGLASYCTPNHVAGQSNKPGLDRDAQNGLKSLVQMLTLSHTLDCNQFADRSLAEKRLLIDGGINVKDMKGLSLPELGQLFSQDLNL
ncbi:hypothetical protein [Pseudomonas serbica]|uniref:hypothetical protein n=1 Tax=Pseudomonas serbica TaxID=2965074 RepID=UPI00237BAC37|nr:hypothetical protein [Pseudomonas serbica]